MSDLPIGTIIFDGASKRYRLGSLGTLRSTVAALANRSRNGEGGRDFWALKDVSFQVEPGASLGLIGPNGAGKTTALKLLSNITQPTAGRITSMGRMSSLIELGAGFHPELSGHDNIFLNGAILGLKRKEIQSKLDEIIDFSELERFIDTPVKRYSSGMYVRLGFAVAAHVEPDILLVDEVLAVGDASFRQKCSERMDELRKSGTTVVFVSHNLAQVRRLCDQSILLIGGQIRYNGDTEESISAYYEHIYAIDEIDSNLHKVSARDSILLRKVSLLSLSDGASVRLRSEEAVTIEIDYLARIKMVDPIVKLWLLRKDGAVCGLSVYRREGSSPWILEGEGTLRARIDPIQLASGIYCAEVRIIDAADSTGLAHGQSPWFQVAGPADLHQADQGVYVPSITWQHDEAVAPFETTSDKEQN